MSLISRISNKLHFILAANHRLARVMTFKNYFETIGNPSSYHCIESERKTVVAPVQFIDEGKVSPLETLIPDTYWGELSNSSIIGGSSVIITEDGKLLYDMLARREEYQANMTDNGLCLIGGSPKHIGDYYIYNHLKSGKLELSSGISLACHMSNNYYHFMLEVAAKFYLLSQIVINVDVPLLVDEQVLSISQMKEVIDALNIDNRTIVRLKPNQLCRVKHLYVISEPNVIVPNSFAKGERRTENFAFDKNALNYLKQELMKRIPICKEKVYPKHIFLSRKGCNKRRCNEEELEKVLSQFGFQSLQIENLSIAQQIALFSNAEHIIGGSGAAFTNLMYCKEGTKATLFFTGRHNVTCFSSLGIVIGMQTFYTYPEDEVGVIHRDYYTINPDTIGRHLKSIYG